MEKKQNKFLDIIRKNERYRIISEVTWYSLESVKKKYIKLDVNKIEDFLAWLDLKRIYKKK